MLRPLLVLDLDETLVFSTEVEPARGYDFRLFAYFVRKRPGPAGEDTGRPDRGTR